MSKRPSTASKLEGGSILGGILLIGGSCLGAGMLGLPVQTGPSGFLPSVGMFFLACLFMTSTALLLLEVNGWFPGKAHLLTMSSLTLGRLGKHVCWITYLFLFYALLVAYISGSGSLLSTMLLGNVLIPSWSCSLFFTLLFGWIVYLGTKSVDYCNRILMVGKIGCFILLIFFIFPHVQPNLLERAEPSLAISSLPLLVIAFGFHNMIPSLTAYFNGNLRKTRTTIIGGSLFALIIYIIWEATVLGVLPLEGDNGLLYNLTHDREASQALAAMLHSSTIRAVAQGLGFFALLTSFLAQTLSLVHFLSDALHIRYSKTENISICLLALVPPSIFSFLFPGLFFQALNFAGGICAVILFGVLPVAMVWFGKPKSPPSLWKKSALVLILGCAIWILVIQVLSMGS